MARQPTSNTNARTIRLAIRLGSDEENDLTELARRHEFKSLHDFLRYCLDMGITDAQDMVIDDDERTTP